MTEFTQYDDISTSVFVWFCCFSSLSKKQSGRIYIYFRKKAGQRKQSLRFKPRPQWMFGGCHRNRYRKCPGVMPLIID